MMRGLDMQLLYEGTERRSVETQLLKSRCIHCHRVAGRVIERHWCWHCLVLDNRWSSVEWLKVA